MFLHTPGKVLIAICQNQVGEPDSAEHRPSLIIDHHLVGLLPGLQEFFFLHHFNDINSVSQSLGRGAHDWVGLQGCHFCRRS